LWRDPDEVREHFGIVGSWIVIRSVKDHQSERDGCDDNAGTQPASNALATIRTGIRIHPYSSSLFDML